MNCVNQRSNDSVTGAVALHMNNAPRGVRSFAANRKLAFKVAVERHAILQQIVDARARLRGKPKCDVFIDDAAANRNRVGGMGFRCIAFGDGRCDSTLGPRGRRALSERRC